MIVQEGKKMVNQS